MVLSACGKKEVIEPTDNKAQTKNNTVVSETVATENNIVTSEEVIAENDTITDENDDAAYNIKSEVLKYTGENYLCSTLGIPKRGGETGFEMCQRLEIKNGDIIDYEFTDKDGKTITANNIIIIYHYDEQADYYNDNYDSVPTYIAYVIASQRDIEKLQFIQDTLSMDTCQVLHIQMMNTKRYLRNT